MIIQIIAAFIAVFTIATVQGVPKRFLVWSGLNSAVSWFVYLVCQDATFSVAISTLVSTLAVALISHILARVFKSPVTVFLIPGILPLVPGVNTYRIVYYLIQEDSSNATFYFYLTLQIAGMIAIGIFIIDTIFRIMFNVSKNKQLRLLRQVIRPIEMRNESTMDTVEEPGNLKKKEKKKEKIKVFK